MQQQNKYARGKIYKIVNDVNEHIYIGSTCQTLKDRFQSHKESAKFAMSKLYKSMREIGVEHFRMELIQNFPCESRDELNCKEYEHIREIRPEYNTYLGFVIQKRRENKLNPPKLGRPKIYQTEEDFKAHRREYMNKRYAENEAYRLKAKERSAAYIEAHKAEIAARNKVYYEAKKALKAAKPAPVIVEVAIPAVEPVAIAVA